MTAERWYSRRAVGAFVLSPVVQRIVIVVILVNAATLGLETSSAVMRFAGDALHVIDRMCLAVFIVEIALKLYAARLRFFTDAWNVFDFLVVGVALIPGADGLAVLRALRVLRVLRLISVVPALRRVVDALVRALPGIASIAALLAIVFYVGAVMATMLFGADFPTRFGDLGASLFSLFQIMTLDNWSVITREVSEVIPWAPAFFVPFVLISALTVLNLFIAVIVDAMQGLDDAEREPAGPDSAEADAANAAGAAVDARGSKVASDAAAGGETARLAAEIRMLRAELAAVSAAVGAGGSRVVEWQNPEPGEDLARISPSSSSD